MNGESKRIIFKRMYVWKLALFGLVWGAILGLIFWPVTFLAAFFKIFQYYITVKSYNPNFGFSLSGLAKLFTVSAIIKPIIYSAIWGFFGGLIGGVIYNTLSRIGINLNWDLVEA